jgi:SAM-dependent methyltransferase
MKLNIGAGDTRYEGFLNCDYDDHCKPDYQFDLEHAVWPFADSTVDQVIAHHVLEHMGEGYFHVMKELYRVCKHGAVIDIRVPHHRHNYFANDPTHRRAITPDGLWLFSKKYNDSCIKQNAAASRLGYYYNVNFEVMDVINVPDTAYIKLFEGKTVVEVEQYMHEHNNIIMEVGIKLVVIKEND